MAYSEVFMRDKVALANLIHYLDHSKKPSINFSETIYGRELMRLDAQQRKIFDELINEANFNSRRCISKEASSSAGINRQRELKRIEKDNQLLQKRIQSAKPQNNFSKKEINKSAGPPLNFSRRCLSCKRRPEWNDRW